MERIKQNPTVQELLTFDNNGMILRSTVDTARAQVYRNSISSLTFIARKTVKNMDPKDDLKFIRMRTQFTEIIVAPDNGATLCVIQNVQPYEPPYRPPKEPLAELRHTEVERKGIRSTAFLKK